MLIFTKIIRISFVTLFFLLLSQYSFAQYQLVQSFIETNNQGQTNFGCSVSTAGDVNNDGYDDVIVGAYYYNDNTGRAYIFHGGSSMDNIADVIMTGEGTSNYFGYSVSEAGDVNNDNYDDVVIGAYKYNGNTGRVYVYYGGNPMDNNADVTMTGEGVLDDFGYSVSWAGDVNNDNYDDVIVGAYYYNDVTGRAYIYYGGSSMDNIADVTMEGDGTGVWFGWSVSGAGDVNNDTYDDVIVGDHFGTVGSAYIYFGGSSMDNTEDVIMMGEGSGDYFGYSVSGGGDVNNDNYDDVIVGAYGWDGGDGDPFTGRAYIFYGSNSMDNTADVTLPGVGGLSYFGRSVSGTGDVNNDNYDDVIVGATGVNSAYIYLGGNPMDVTADVTLSGENSGDNFSISVSGAGDVNNDTYADVIVGASYYNSGTGSAYVYHGNSSMDNIADITMTGEGNGNYFGYSVSGAGDVNNDTFDDVIVGANYYNSGTGRVYIYYGGSSMNSSADVTITGEGVNNYFGVSVSSAGDVNNDTYDDVIVGASSYNSNTGRAYIYYGGTSMDNVTDVTMTGEAIGSYFGWSISGAGDVNNDNYDDVIVGADGYNFNTGRVYIFHGGSTMDNTADVIMTGIHMEDYFGRSVSGAGDVNNDDYDDVIVGANGYYANTGRAYIYFGSSSMNNAADIIITGELSGHRFGYSVSGAGDFNNDSYDDVVVGAYGYNSFTGRSYIYYGDVSMDNNADIIITGESTENDFGRSVSGVGDVNNDSYDDVIIGARDFSFSTGRVYIYYGNSSMDNTADVIIDGEGIGDNFGCSVSEAGDVNNDSYNDVIVGAYGYPLNGKAYIFSLEQNPVDFSTTISVSDNCANTIDLIIGTAPDATDDFDPAYDQYAPPSPPGNNFDARFHIVGVDLIFDYRGPNTGKIEWDLEVKAESGCESVTIQWDPTKLPDDGSLFKLIDSANDGDLVDINMRLISSYVDVNNYQQFKIINALTAFCDVELIDGWRIIGVSVDPLDPVAANLFPNIIPPLYGFDGSYYSVTEIDTGVGEKYSE